MEATICKNLFLCDRRKTAFYLLMLPGNKPFRTALLSKAIGSSRLSFAASEDMEALLDVTPGSVSVLGLMNDHEHRVRLLVDNEVVSGEFIGCHPCINTTSLRLKTADLFTVVLPALGYQPTFVEL